MSENTAAQVIAPSVEASVAMGKGKAHTFRLHTMQLASEAGWQVSTEAPYDNVVIFTRGELSVRVTYSKQDFVRKAEGAITIEPKQAEKWKRLNEALVELAKAEDAKAAPEAEAEAKPKPRPRPRSRKA